MRTWYGNGIISFGLGADDAGSLSWAADERTLAFDWDGSNPGVWLLNLDAGGSNLLADSRLAAQPTCDPDVIVTPDGSAVVYAATAGLNPRMVGTTPERGAETEFFEYSTATGKIARILGHWTSPKRAHTDRSIAVVESLSSVLIGVMGFGCADQAVGVGRSTRTGHQSPAEPTRRNSQSHFGTDSSADQCGARPTAPGRSGLAQVLCIRQLPSRER